MARPLGHSLALVAVTGAVAALSACGAEDVGREIDGEVNQVIRDPTRAERAVREQRRRLNLGLKEAERLTR